MVLHDFVNHKYNVLLKRNDVCLMPLNIYIFCVCVYVYVFHREDFIFLEQLKCQGTDQ